MATTFPWFHGAMHSCRSQRRDWLAVAVGADFRRRALPSVWVRLGLVAILVGVLAMDGPGMRAAAIVLVALLCHLAIGRPGMVPFKRCGCVAMLLLALWMPFSGTLGPMDADILAWLAVAIAAALLLGCVGRVLWLSRELKRAVVAFEDAELLALLPAEMAPQARRWIEGDDGEAGALAVILPLAALHLALGRCGGADERIARGLVAS